MPSSGYYNESTADDSNMIQKIIDELQTSDDGHFFGMLSDVLGVYVSARIAGASPAEAAQAGYIEWDL